MGWDEKLLEVAFKAVKAANNGVDSALPAKIAGIVKAHAAVAAGAAWIPVPGVDVAASAGAVWGMYYRINDELGLPFGKNIVKSVASAVGTNLAATVGLLTVGSFLKVIPGLGSVAGAVLMTAALYGVTMASGFVYLKVITALLEQKSAKDVTDSDFKAAVERVTSDRKELTSFIQDAKASYKK